MSKKQSGETTTTAVTDLSFFDKRLQEAEVEGVIKTPLDDFGFKEIKVYNPKMWDKPDPDKVWKIFCDWVSIGSEINCTILVVRKLWQGYVPNKFVNPKTWEKWKDYYCTNQMWVFEKSPCFFKWCVKSQDDWEDVPTIKNVLIWSWTTDDLQKLLVDKWSPFYFKEQETLDKSSTYSVSRVNRDIVIYIKDDKWNYYYLDPKSSYWKYNNVKEWTIEYLKESAQKELKKQWKNYKSIDLSLCKVKAVVKEYQSAVKYWALHWTFEWFITEDNSADIDHTKKAINAYMDYLFPASLIWNPVPLKLISDTSAKQEEVLLDKLPF